MARKGWTALIAAAAALAAASGAGATAPAEALFYQRALMSAAGGDCGFFGADVAQALAVSEAQARGAALRSGDDPASLAAVEARAQATARAAGCRSGAMVAAARQVREAFAGYAKLERMDFPGQVAGWTAERAAASPRAEWRVVQRARFGWNTLLFGLAGRGAGGSLVAVAQFQGGARPYAARLLMRDPSLAEAPYLDGAEADIDGRLPLEARLPPRADLRVFAAEAMTPADPSLETSGVKDAWAFRFPAAAAEALARLDPREAVAVEFLFADPTGESRRTAYVEVGDFDAALAFQAIVRR